MMVPMQFAPKEASGAGFVVSFGIGASIVTLILWLLNQCLFHAETLVGQDLSFLVSTLILYGHNFEYRINSYAM